MKLFLGRLHTTHDVLRYPSEPKILPHALQPHTLYHQVKALGS
jgi:hypothetical protein